ncbi:MAG: hypothetical protein RL238_3225 [Actinomycetota bacterium]|jgi:membrane protein DedA with SNARE-associated domain
MIDWAAELIDTIGLVGVAVLIALESIVPPIPSELVLLLSGFNVSEGRFGFVAAVIAATIGSVAGALALYGVGAWVSEERLERLLATVGRFVGLRRDDIDRGFRWFERHGRAVVFFGRLIPLVRSVVSLPAGADRMPLRTFLPYTLAGSLLWNTVWISIGRALGENWRKAERWGEVIELAAIVVLVVGLVVLVVRSRRHRQRTEP